MSNSQKLWKNGAEEDKFIVQLITKGKITKFTKPSDLKKEYPKMFSMFSTNVIRNHLNDLKRRYGVFLCDDGEEAAEQDEDSPQEKSADTENGTKNSSSSISFKNFPVMTARFKQPDTLKDKLILVVAITGGVTDVRLELNKDGTEAIIKYFWPNTMHDMGDLFKSNLLKNIIQDCHPKIVSLNTELELVRNKIDFVPECTLIIKLPMQVQTASGTWEHQGVKREDGSLVVVAEFHLPETDYVKKYTHQYISFDE